MPDLVKLLLGGLRSEVLGILLLHPEQSFYLREIGRLTGSSVGTLHRELTALVEVGVLNKTRAGNHVMYQASMGCPIFSELASILRKTVGLADVLRDALAPLHDRIGVAVVFGSMARAEARAGSDVDLLVVGDVTFHEVVLALAPTQEVLLREVNPIVLTPAAFRERYRAHDAFLERVLKEPLIPLIGTTDDIGQLAQGR